jgi:hypothetical protein
MSAEGADMSPAELGKPLDTSDFERRIRDLVIPAIRKQYRVTGHYLNLEAAAEVIQVVRLGLLAAGWGELTEEQLVALGTVLEYQIHQQLRPQSGRKKDVVSEIEQLWAARQAAHTTLGVPPAKTSSRVPWVAIMSLFGMLLGMGLATLFFYSRGMMRHEVGADELEKAILAQATWDAITNRLAELQAKVARYRCPNKAWEDDQKEVFASQKALVKAAEHAEYARGRLDGLAHPKSITIPEPTAYHINRMLGIVGKMVQDQKSLLPRGAVEQARAELLRAVVEEGRLCK